jgi:hypothetical protein
MVIKPLLHIRAAVVVELVLLVVTQVEQRLVMAERDHLLQLTAHLQLVQAVAVV